ncbi:MAG TPA: hypothetical protein PKJ51_00100 [Methanothrix sp.]|nr:hypothetical protein [Methanothrix sp.]
MVLSPDQRARLTADITTAATTAGLSVLPERQRIENSTDFPLLQVTFLAEGRRSRCWNTILHDYQYDTSHEWESHRGHFAEATVSISIRALDHEDLQQKVYSFFQAFWPKAINWRLETEPAVEFRGAASPQFLPAYLDAVERHDVYSCVLDFFVEYEFTWIEENPPIKSVHLEGYAGLIDTEDYSDEISLYGTAPGCYLMASTIHGPPVAYQMAITIIEEEEI